jgi:RHH-type rel operon transcriptional repressor/antitoxin RelB
MLAIRLDAQMERRLAALARRQRRTKSQIAREALRQYLEGESLAAEARRQSLHVSRTAAERDAVRFVEHAADTGDTP